MKIVPSILASIYLKERAFLNAKQAPESIRQNLNGLRELMIKRIVNLRIWPHDSQDPQKELLTSEITNVFL